MSLIYAIGVAIVAQIFIYSGLIFMAGKLLPNLLTPVYHLVPTPSSRLLFSSLTVMLIGNYFFQHLYSLQPVLIAGIISTAGRYSRSKRRRVDYRTKDAEYFNGPRSYSACHRRGYLRIRSEPALTRLIQEGEARRYRRCAPADGPRLQSSPRTRRLVNHHRTGTPRKFTLSG